MHILFLVSMINGFGLRMLFDTVTSSDIDISESDGQN